MAGRFALRRLGRGLFTPAWAECSAPLGARGMAKKAAAEVEDTEDIVVKAFKEEEEKISKYYSLIKDVTFPVSGTKEAIQEYYTKTSEARKSADLAGDLDRLEALVDFQVNTVHQGNVRASMKALEGALEKKVFQETMDLLDKVEEESGKALVAEESAEFNKFLDGLKEIMESRGVTEEMQTADVELMDELERIPGLLSKAQAAMDASVKDSGLEDLKVSVTELKLKGI